jgi:ATP-dependent DNA ligase
VVSPLKPPKWVKPQLTRLVDDAPAGPNWLHEVKYDGYRMHARLVGGKAQLLTRTGLDWSNRYPSTIKALQALSVKSAYLDGELCALGPDGVPAFSRLQTAMDEGRTDALVFMVFDLLFLDGKDTGKLPLLDGVEGVISKRVDRPYAPGDRGLWLKSKCLNREEFVVVGWTDPGGSRSHFGALLLGYYTETGRLNYAGRAGTGFDERELARLAGVLKPLATRRMPLATPPPRENRFGSPLELSRVHWVRPELVVEVTYLTWTEGGLLRAVSYQGQREDKPARQVVRPGP